MNRLTAALAAIVWLGATFTCAAQRLHNEGRIGYEPAGGLRASYSSATFSSADGGCGLHGFSLGYHTSVPLSVHAPLFLETGGGFTYTGGSMAGSAELDLWSLYLPVNVGYQFAPSRSVRVFPYAGIMLRGNLVGHYRMGGESLDAFYRDEVGDAAVMNRFQGALSVGVSFTFNGFTLGTSLTRDMTEICPGTRVTMARIGLGFNF